MKEAQAGEDHDHAVFVRGTTAHLRKTRQHCISNLAVCGSRVKSRPEQRPCQPRRLPTSAARCVSVVPAFHVLTTSGYSGAHPFRNDEGRSPNDESSPKGGNSECPTVTRPLGLCPPSSSYRTENPRFVKKAARGGAASVQFPDMRDPSIELRATLRVGLQWRRVATGVAPRLNRLCVQGGRPQFSRGAHGGETAPGGAIEQGLG
jgi:hypothetical protein